MKPFDFLFFLLLLYSIFLNISFVVGAVPPLNLTVTTDKTTYLRGESMRVSGSLSLGVNPLVDWPVAISINMPNGAPLFLTTLQADENGNFDTIFNLSSESELGTYTLLASVQWTNQHAIREVTFEIKATTQPGDEQPQVPQIPLLFFNAPLTIIVATVAFSLAIFTLISYRLVTFQKKVEAPVSPTTLVRKVDIIGYETCAKCGKTFLGIYTFCPYCFTFHRKPQTKYEVFEALNLIMKTLKEREKVLVRLITELNKTTEILSEIDEPHEKIGKVEEHLSAIQSEISNLINFVEHALIHN